MLLLCWVLWLWVLFVYGRLGLVLLLDGAVRWLRLPCWFCLRYFLLVGFVCILCFVAGSGLFGGCLGGFGLRADLLICLWVV